MHDLIHSQTLPRTFMHGYFLALQEVAGYSQIMTYCYIAAKRHVQDREACDRWVQPLYDYFGKAKLPHEFFDYALVRLFHEGLRITLQRNPGLDKCEHLIGQKWWFGYPPLYPHVDNYSLYALTSSPILRNLNAWKYDATQENHPSVPNARAFARKGLAYFVAELQTQAQLSCQLTEAESTLTLDMLVCPICSDLENPCKIFFGVVDGVIAWLHGSHQPNRMTELLTINYAESTGHHIIINIK